MKNKAVIFVLNILFSLAVKGQDTAIPHPFFSGNDYFFKYYKYLKIKQQENFTVEPVCHLVVTIQQGLTGS